MSIIADFVRIIDSDKLSRQENFLIYSRKFKGEAQVRGLLPILEGRLLEPQEPKEAQEAWGQKNSQLIGALLATIDTKQLMSIPSFDNAAKFWKHLENKFAPRLFGNEQAKQKELRNLTMDAGETFDSLLTRFSTLVFQYESIATSPLSDKEKSQILLDALNEAYMSVKIAFICDEPDKVTVDAIISAAKVFEIQMQPLSSPSSSSINQVTNYRSSTTTHHHVQCNKCSGYGHIASRCPTIDLDATMDQIQNSLHNVSFGQGAYRRNQYMRGNRQDGQRGTHGYRGYGRGVLQAV